MTSVGWHVTLFDPIWQWSHERIRGMRYANRRILYFTLLSWQTADWQADTFRQYCAGDKKDVRPKGNSVICVLSTPALVLHGTSRWSIAAWSVFLWHPVAKTQ